MDPRYDHDHDQGHADHNHDTVEHREVVERDTGTSMGVVLGVILAVILAVALLWFILGANLFGTGTGPDTTPGGPGIEQPQQPGGGQPGGGEAPGGTAPGGAAQ
jgi:hypothetical protein